MKKFIKKFVVGSMLVSMLFSGSVSTFAATPNKGTVNAAEQKQKVKEEKKVKATPQKISKVTCTAAGKINVSFKNTVTYTSAVAAKLTDASGKAIACKIEKKNKNLMTIAANGLVKGQKYTLTITGVKAQNVDQAATITQTFTANGMKTECEISKTDTKVKNSIVLQLKGSAEYKNATVTVVDAKGNALNAKITSKSKGSIKIAVTGMKKGQKYTVTVNGVKVHKENNYSSISKTFTA